MPNPPNHHRARPARRVHAQVFAATLTALFSGLAMAENSPWYLGAAIGWSHDSNVFRVPDALARSAGLSQSDRITTATLLGGLDQPFGRQRLFGTATLRNNRFATNRVLDNTGYSLKLGLDWSAAERLSGNLNMTANRELAFLNPDSGVPTLLHGNLARTGQIDGAVRYGLVARWQVEGSFGSRNMGYSSSEYRSRENHEEWASAGLRYRPSGALGLGLAWRQGLGHFPKFGIMASGEFQVDRFRNRNLDLTADWIASGASSLNARLSIGRLTHSVAAQRDYSGLTGELRWLWRPTGKLLVTTTLARETGQEFGAGTSFFVTGTDLSRTVNGVRVRAEHELSGKLNLNAGLSRSRRALVDTESTILGVPFVVTGVDNTNVVSLGLHWMPTRNAQLLCDFSHERRSTDGRLSSAFGVNVLGCNGQVTLQ